GTGTPKLVPDGSVWCVLTTRLVYRPVRQTDASGSHLDEIASRSVETPVILDPVGYRKLKREKWVHFLRKQLTRAALYPIVWYQREESTVATKKEFDKRCQELGCEATDNGVTIE